jgi:predicted acetyltransferase
MLPEAKAQGLPYVEIVTDVDNTASQHVIVANGGVLIEHFQKGPEHFGGEGCRFRIDLRKLEEGHRK